MKKFLLLCFSFVFVLSAWAQERVVQGKVTAQEDGSALPGVNVVLKGTTNGTVTDADGNFKLNVPSGGGSLVFSFIGLQTQEVPIGDRSVVDVQLGLDVQQLTEVVVTAVGIEREKKALGYSVANVSGSAMQQRSEPDPLRSLQGKMPGVQIIGGSGAPGSSTKINIRGYSSLTGSTQPLFVVDGIPFNNDVNASTGGDGGANYSNRAFDLDPNNIESLTVLKGAAAAALYGSRATNGVVVITTKAARKNSKKGLEVTYNGSLNFEKIAGLPEYQDVYTQGSNQNYNGGFIGNWGTVFPDQVDRVNSELGFNRYSKDIAPGYPTGYVANPLTGVGYGISKGYPAIFPELMEDTNGDGVPDRAAPYKLEPHDIVNQFFQTGRVIENGLSINNSTDKVSLNTTVSRMKQEGIIPNQEATRTTLAFGGSGQLDNGLFISGNVNYVNTTQQAPQGGSGVYGDYGGGTGGSLFDRLFYLPRNFDLMGLPFETPTGDNVFYRALDNPRWVSKYNLYNSTVNRAYGNITMGYDVTDWLNVTFKGGLNTYSENRRNLVRKGGTAIPAGSVWTDDLTYTEQDYNLIFTFTKDFSEKFTFRGLLGGNANQRGFNRIRVIGQDFIVPGLYTLANTTTQIVAPGQDSRSLRRLYGAYTDLTFTYNKYLNVNFVARNDWASTLPKENRSFFYPGVSVAFVLTDATDALDNIFSFAKLRAAYTQVGREASPYQTSTTFSVLPSMANSRGTYRMASLDNTVGNLTLVNEKTKEIEFGGEFRHKSDRVALDITWFKRNSSDQITPARISSSSGFTSAIINSGEIENKGWEIGLNATPLKMANGLQWDMYFAFTRFRSTVISAGQGDQLIYGSFGYVSNVHRKGSPYGQVLGTRNTHDEEGNLLINESTGRPYVQPVAGIIANPIPNFTLGWTNTITYKGFTLMALIDWQQGGQIYSFSAASLFLRGQLKITEDREATRVVPGVYGDPTQFTASADGYTYTGAAVLDENGQKIRNTTGITAFDYHFSDGFGAYGADETNVYDATVIRLREVSLGYNIPKSVLSKTPFGSARVSVSGRNLWWNAPNLLQGLHLDPQVLPDFSSSNSLGVETGNTPTTKRLGVNVNLTF